MNIQINTCSRERDEIYSKFFLQENTNQVLFESRLGEDVVKFGQIYGESPYFPSMVEGNVVTFKEHTIYLSQWYPLFVQYSPDGSIKYARATMDYVSIEEPKMIEIQRGWRIDGPSLIGDFPMVYRGQLCIHSNIAQTIDIYDATTGDYQHSIKLSENRFYTCAQRPDLPGRRQHGLDLGNRGEQSAS